MNHRAKSRSSTAHVPSTLCVICLLMVCWVMSGGCQQAEYPSRTITIVCPWAAGGGTDRNSRFWAEQLESELGTRVIVKNRTGGSGATGHAAGANAKPDGYTLTMITAELSTMHHMGISKLSHKDYRPLLQMNADAAALLVRQDADWADLNSLLDEIRSNPKTIKMSGTATGGTWDLARAGLLYSANISVDSVIWVPTDGAAPSLTKLLAGQVDVVCCSLPEAESQLASGQLRALVVMSEERLPDYPATPTCIDAGVDWIAMGWRGLAVPADTPEDVVDQLLAAAESIVESKRFDSFMSENKFGVAVRMGADFEAFLAEQDELWQPVVAAAGYDR